jgi:predicted DsbA family dithiol-disulfide isomerase
MARGRSAFEAMANEAGLEVGVRRHWYNTDLAHEAKEWAAEQGKAEELHRAILRAYFVDDRNIGSPDVLVDLANGVGLNGEDLRTALNERRYRQVVLDQYQEAREIGVTAVPTFVADNYAIVGAHPYETFRRLMAAVGAARIEPQ